MISFKGWGLKTAGALSLAAFLLSPAWGGSIPPQQPNLPAQPGATNAIPAQSGSINYIEGQASINGQFLTEKSVGTVRLLPGQTLTTQNGRVEILLTPGVFLRVSDHSSVMLNSAGLADNVVTLQSGRALVEVADILPANNIRVILGTSNTRLVKPGLYDFDAARGQIRVFDGKADVQDAGRQFDLGRSHELTLQAAKLKPQKFNPKNYTDDFYRWSSLRASYLAEANVDAARRYGATVGYSPYPWYGNGWYWDPWFGAYTFIPADGIFYDPFGWGFYSPWFAPYWGFGLGFGYGYGLGYGGYHHHFGPGYHPAVAPNTSHGLASVGHAYSVGRGGFAGGFHGGTYGGGFARGAYGGGFHGGGFHGGGFHGGGGGGRR
jgi:hypothetical protein